MSHNESVNCHPTWIMRKKYVLLPENNNNDCDDDGHDGGNSSNNINYGMSSFRQPQIPSKPHLANDPYGGPITWSGSLRQCLKNSIHFLRHCSQSELELGLWKQQSQITLSTPFPFHKVFSMKGRIDVLGQQRATALPRFSWGLFLCHTARLTFVLTIEGLWSRRCSRVAAMSISFAPSRNKQTNKQTQETTKYKWVIGGTT